MAKNSIPDDIKGMSFEAALEELQRIVAQLESGQGKLEEAIGSYQRGAALKQHCENKLRQAKQDLRAAFFEVMSTYHPDATEAALKEKCIELAAEL